MKKIIAAILIAVLLAIAPAVSEACHRCGDNHYTTNKGGKGGKGGDADATATGVGIGIGTSFVDVDNEIDADFHNNVNVSITTPKGQEAKQSKPIVMEGAQQSLTIKDQKQPVNYDHISPDVDMMDADLVDQEEGVSSVKLNTSILMYDDDDLITAVELNGVDTGDIEVTRVVINEPDVRLKEINYGSSPSSNKTYYVGSLTLRSESANADQLMARACLEAMEIGATHVKFRYSTAKHLGSTQSGIGFGGSASVAMAEDGSAIVAPGFGTGYSRVKSKNEYRPELYVVMFHDPAAIQ